MTCANVRRPFPSARLSLRQSLHQWGLRGVRAAYLRRHPKAEAAFAGAFGGRASSSSMIRRP